jgi:putative transposase
MSQSLVQVYLHIVYSTKERRPFLQNQDLRHSLHSYLAGACRNLETPSLKVGGVEDHIHILCRMAKVISISDLIKELKRESSKWVKQQKSVLRRFYWQSGYGAFSVSPSHVDGLIGYINNQKEHHKHESFQDEFRRLCKKYGVTIDERYVWN